MEFMGINLHRDERQGLVWALVIENLYNLAGLWSSVLAWLSLVESSFHLAF